MRLDQGQGREDLFVDGVGRGALESPGFPVQLRQQPVGGLARRILVLGICSGEQGKQGQRRGPDVVRRIAGAIALLVRGIEFGERRTAEAAVGGLVGDQPGEAGANGLLHGFVPVGGAALGAAGQHAGGGLLGDEGGQQAEGDGAEDPLQWGDGSGRGLEGNGGEGARGGWRAGGAGWDTAGWRSPSPSAAMTRSQGAGIPRQACIIQERLQVWAAGGGLTCKRNR